MPAAALSYWAEVVAPVEAPGGFVLDQGLRVPFAGPGGPLWGGVAGELALRQRTFPGDSTSAWAGGLHLAAGPFRGYLVHNDHHRSSTEPFRLVHYSAWSPGAWAGGVQWLDRWSGLVQFVEAVPLRRQAGPLLVGQLAGPAPWPRLTWVGYGTTQLRHHFYVLDGALDLSPGARLRWGGAWQQGLEVAALAGPVAFASVAEGAAFARLEASRGRHRYWLALHGTSPGFRSLVADDYPFLRGRAAMEGRWQFRLQTSRLLSVYGHVAEPLDGRYAPSREVEVRYSAAPRRQWAWHLGGAWRWREGEGTILGWEAGLRDPARRLDLSVEMEAGGAGVRWRPRVQWRAPDWHLRVAADTALAGWRLQWVHTGHPLWELTVVYKQRWDPAGGLPVRDWLYLRVARRLPDRGQVWLRWGDHDQGRLDVGWAWPAEVAVGIDLAL